MDRAVQDADTYEEFLENLEYMGYELSGKKHLALREIGAERARRIDLFGEEYTEEMLRCRIEKPPVPAQQEDRKEAELLYIYIPYRNRHLTRHQKECFIRKYRVGKIHKSPKQPAGACKAAGGIPFLGGAWDLFQRGPFGCENGCIGTAPGGTGEKENAGGRKKVLSGSNSSSWRTGTPSDGGGAL